MPPVPLLLPVVVGPMSVLELAPPAEVPVAPVVADPVVVAPPVVEPVVVGLPVLPLVVLPMVPVVGPPIVPMVGPAVLPFEAAFEFDFESSLLQAVAQTTANAREDRTETCVRVSLDICSTVYRTCP